MPAVLETAEFSKWISGLRDGRARGRILDRIVRLMAGNPGDVKPVGGGVSEVRIDYGPGYRLYFIRRASETILLLCGGDKKSRARDISRAKALAAEWKERATWR